MVLAEVIAQSKKERAEIEAQADVAVRRSAMEAERLRLNIVKEEKQARIAQIRDIQKFVFQTGSKWFFRANRIFHLIYKILFAEQERQIVIAQKSEEESV